MGLVWARSTFLRMFINRLPSCKSSTSTLTDALAMASGSGGSKLTVPYSQDLCTWWIVTLACASPSRASSEAVCREVAPSATRRSCCRCLNARSCSGVGGSADLFLCDPRTEQVVRRLAPIYACGGYGPQCPPAHAASDVQLAPLFGPSMQVNAVEP